MKLIELHILQSFPVSCLNRDDVGAPKTARFGGVTRARISSQCFKRAIRHKARELNGERFQGSRTKLVIEPLRDALIAEGIEEARALVLAKQLGDEMATFDEKAENDSQILKVKTLMYLGTGEIAAVAKSAAALEKADEGNFPVVQEGKKKLSADDTKTLTKNLKGAITTGFDTQVLSDAADIAIFGRMMASHHSLTLEGAGMFSHALSTHSQSNEIDFWTAVDDAKEADEKSDDAGAGQLGVSEYASATFYRYIALNLDLLGDEAHLGKLDKDERKEVVRAFLQASLLAVPSARQNSMNAHTLPAFALGTYKSAGQPVQLVNAFERGVRDSADGYLEPSRTALQNHETSQAALWGLNPQTRVEFGDHQNPEGDQPVNLEAFLDQLVAHVE